MGAQELYQEGKLDEAIQALSTALRNDPTDVRRRTFLFELLCFAGEYDRAEKHLDILSASSREAEMGALLLKSALHAERIRQGMFQGATLPDGGKDRPEAVSGKLNGRAFASLTDADPRIGTRLEVFAAGQYTWLPLEHVASITMEEPRRLRELLWAPARVQTGPGFPGLELGEVLVPLMAPLSWRETDPELRLGRASDWVELADGSYAPVGQKLLLVDGEAVPLSSVRTLEIDPTAPEPDA